MKVIYFINYAPNYRDVFLRNLGQFVDLTVVSYSGDKVGLKDPPERIGYKYIGLDRRKFLNINFNLREYTLANEDYDVVIVGYTLWNPLRMINLFRKEKRVICEGLIYGRSNGYITKMLRKMFINASEGVLVYSQIVKNKLEKETAKPIIIFNNTSYTKEDIYELPLPPLDNKLNVLWVGRYQPRKKIEVLHRMAKEDNRIHVRLVGPGIREALMNYEKLNNLEIFDAAYDDELYQHFEFSHLVMNPGGAGLLVMNAARFHRPIVIDSNSHHGPEIQLAIEAGQDFINFADPAETRKFVDDLFEKKYYLEAKANAMSNYMQNYTIEYMTQKYLEAIEGKWIQK